MVYFCADDYGISKKYNVCIEKCLEKGALNKISVLPNGEIDEISRIASNPDVILTLHLNLVEGRPLSPLEDVRLLVDADGYFRYSFIGLLLLSLSPKRKALEQQLYKEIQSQLRFWRQQIGDDRGFSLDSHQHAYMVPWVFKTLMRVIRDEGVDVKYIRIPAEPIMPYIMTPSLYLEYKPVGIIKQWLLKFLALVNRRELKKSKINSAYFMGIMFSGKLNKKRVNKLLPQYIKLANKRGKNIEIGFHPGYSEGDQHLIDGSRRDFKKFYCSPWRNIEYETLMNDERHVIMKEGK